ncbi:transposase [Streptomyces sp. NPDC002519]
MGSKKQPYDAEFREGVVRIVIETGKPVPDVAEELGVNPGTLHSWVSRWRRNGTASSDRPAQTATRTEARLRIATWITGFYNPRRRHSAADGLPPEEFERIIIEARNQSGQRCQAA